MVIAYPILAVLATVFLAGRICIYGLRRKNRISLNAVALSPVIANTVVFMASAFLFMGTAAFSLEEWANLKDVKSILFFAVITASICLFPALAVAGYYEYQKNVRNA